MNGISTISGGATEDSVIPKISSILFDMDGVLINSEPLHEFTLLELSERFGRRFESEAELQQFKGLPEASIASLLKKKFPAVTLANDEITKLRIKDIRANFQVVQMIEGALDFVKRCKSAGFRLGLTTSASGAVQQLAFETFGLAKYFDAIITGEDIQRGKPDPEPYLLTAAKLAQPTSDCMVVEDAVSGVMSGKAAGCFVVGLTTSFMAEDLVNAGADLVFSSFAGLGSKVFNSQQSSRSAIG
ncbi:MAG TPA: HAD family phosphatase [Terrimicrobiaceae bacterium]